MNYSGDAVFEIQSATLEEFLSVLQKREEDAAIKPPLYTPLPRRAVYVEMLLDERLGNYNLPFRTRYVLATFSYGADLVSFKSVTSRSLEMGPPSEDTRKMRDAQIKEYRRIKKAIDQKIGELGIASHVPVLEGRLRAITSYYGSYSEAPDEAGPRDSP